MANIFDTTIDRSIKYKTGVPAIDKATLVGINGKIHKRFDKGKRTRGGAASPDNQKEAVKAKLRMLAEAGFYKGKIDGIWGNKSKAAEVAYNKLIGKKGERVTDAVSRNYLNIKNIEKNYKENNSTKTLIFNKAKDFLSNLIPDSLTENTSQPVIEPNIGSAIYLDFADHPINLTKDTGVPILENIAKKTGIEKLPLGHSAVILLDKNGNSKYYEYGRYDSGYFGENSDGNYRTFKVPNMLPEESLDSYINRIAEKNFPSEPTIKATRYFGTDINKAEQDILTDANNKNRNTYSTLIKNCKTTAKKAALTGLNPLDLVFGKSESYTYKR